MAVEEDLSVWKEKPKEREACTQLIDKEYIWLEYSEFIGEEDLQDEMVLSKDSANNVESRED